MSEALFDAPFLRELEVLRRKFEVRARGGSGGEHLVTRRGHSVEFQEHRAYSPGDDVRRMDWAAYARTGEPVLKLFRAEEDVVVRLLVDGSESMQGEKFDSARRLAAAIGYMALCRGERVQILFSSEKRDELGPPLRGRAQIPALFAACGSRVAKGQTDLVGSVTTLVARSPRPGLLVVVSDFFDSNDVMTALTRAEGRGHELGLLQVLHPDEVDPPFEGDVTLVDSETNELVHVTMDRAAQEAYRTRLFELSASLAGFAKRHQGRYQRVIAGRPLEPTLRRFVSKTIDDVAP